jgi:hypothetical protein
MNFRKLKIACYKYVHTQSLFDGSIKLENYDVEFRTDNRIDKLFERMIKEDEFDVSELGLTFYLRCLEMGDCPFIAIPIFPNRQFRHSAIFVNKASGIKAPKDMEGKVIGEFATYSHDAGTVAKGILSDEYGVKLEKCKWIIGGFDYPMQPLDFIPYITPENVDVKKAPLDKALGTMLDSGEIDAFITADVPRCFLDNSSNVERLFPNYEDIERDYYRRTDIFPIMHTVVIRKELMENDPNLAKAVYNAFCEAKDIAMQHYLKMQYIYNTDTMIPWFNTIFEKNRELFPKDWWPYGLKENYKAVDTFLRWQYEQGITKKRWTCEEIFLPEFFNI